MCGVRYFDSDGDQREARAQATLLATGGAGQVFRETTNPARRHRRWRRAGIPRRGAGGRPRIRAVPPDGAELPGAPRFLISEAIRGEGARLVNARGEPFMNRYHADGDLAPRDVVARSIVREAERTRRRCVSLARASRCVANPRAVSDDRRDVQAVRPRSRQRSDSGRPGRALLDGGIDTDEWGRTSLPRLFAAGEAACTGVHGANRLASNSLLEGLVFGARAAAAMVQPPARSCRGRPQSSPRAGCRSRESAGTLAAASSPPTGSARPDVEVCRTVSDAGGTCGGR